MNKKTLGVSALVTSLCVFLGPAGAFSTGECVDVKFKDNLDNQKFFTGGWFVERHSEDFPSVNCPSFEFKHDGLATNMLYYYYYPYNKKTKSNKVGKYIEKRGTVQKDGNHYVLKYNKKLRFSDEQMFILDTDYDRWALVYICKPYFFGKTDATLVLSRNRTLILDINPIITSAGYDPQMYVKSDVSDCGPNEPSL